MLSAARWTNEAICVWCALAFSENKCLVKTNDALLPIQPHLSHGAAAAGAESLPLGRMWWAYSACCCCLVSTSLRSPLAPGSALRLRPASFPPARTGPPVPTNAGCSRSSRHSSLLLLLAGDASTIPSPAPSKPRRSSAPETNRSAQASPRSVSRVRCEGEKRGEERLARECEHKTRGRAERHLWFGALLCSRLPGQTALHGRRSPCPAPPSGFVSSGSCFVRSGSCSFASRCSRPAPSRTRPGRLRGPRSPAGRGAGLGEVQGLEEGERGEDRPP